MQFGRSENILRFEIKTRKMEHIKETDIRTLADLLDPEKLNKLASILLETFNGLMIVDKPEKVLTEKEKETYRNGINPKYWESIMPDSKDYRDGSKHPEYKRRYKKYNRELIEFTRLLSRHDLTKTKDQLYHLIQEKCRQLLSTDIETQNKINTFLNDNTNHEKREKLTIVPTIAEIPKMGEINTLYEGEFLPSHNVGDYNDEFKANDNQQYFDSVKKVLHDYYDILYTDHRIMSKHTLRYLREECRRKDGIVLTENEFLDYAKMAEPTDLVPPF